MNSIDFSSLFDRDELELFRSRGSEWPLPRQAPIMTAYTDIYTFGIMSTRYDMDLARKKGEGRFRV